MNKNTPPRRRHSLIIGAIAIISLTLYLLACGFALGAAL